MKTKSSYNYLNTIAVLLAALFILLLFNRSLFIHSHIDEAGRLVSHSHPYNKADDTLPVKEHGHLGKLLDLFLLLDENFTFFQYIPVYIFFAAVSLFFTVFIAPQFKNFALSFRNPRAPPILHLSI